MQKPAYMRWLPAEALKTISRLEFLTHGSVDGFVSGKHKSTRKGASVEFSEHRQYVPGDDLRDLDWKLVARRQRLYVKQYVDETNLRATIVLDTSGSMGYAGKWSADGLTKLDYAKYFAASLAYLLVSQQDGVGFVSYDTKVNACFPAKSSPAQVRHILETIDTLTCGGETETADVLHEVAERIPRRSVVFIISDFFHDAKELIRALRHLKFRHHEVVAIQIVDPDEAHFPFEQLKMFEDLEGDRRLDVDGRAIRAEYMKRFRKHVDEVKRGCGEMRITHEYVETSKKFHRAFADILVRYRQMGVGR